jgi:hypothetical protein
VFLITDRNGSLLLLLLQGSCSDQESREQLRLTSQIKLLTAAAAAAAAAAAGLLQ